MNEGNVLLRVGHTLPIAAHSGGLSFLFHQSPFKVLCVVASTPRVSNSKRDGNLAPLWEHTPMHGQSMHWIFANREELVQIPPSIHERFGS